MKTQKLLMKSKKWLSHCSKNSRVTLARDEISKIADESKK
jgi:hypothetical protein